MLRLMVLSGGAPCFFEWRFSDPVEWRTQRVFPCFDSKFESSILKLVYSKKESLNFDLNSSKYAKKESDWDSKVNSFKVNN
jgi:hypothetical protein